MSIINRNKRIIFLLAGFIFALLLVSFETPATAEASIEDAMKNLGCNTVKNCDAFCDLGENNTSGICDAYFVFRDNFSELENAMTLLDYCATMEECNDYCETNVNLYCLDYYGVRNDTDGLGKLYNRLKKGDFLIDRDVPGGCSGVSDVCRRYNDGLARQVLSVKNAIENNIPLPKICRNHVSCTNYCYSQTSECIDYEEKAGFLSSQEAEFARKFLAYKARGGETPFGCRTLRDCQNVCNVPENYTECTQFAKKTDWIEKEVPPEQQAVFAAMQKGESPGQCKDEISCRNYCEDIDHIEECVNFVGKFNLASPDELKEIRQMADVRKAGVQFPGNCKTKESCLKYCDNSANAVVCMEFAQKAGFIPKEDAEAVNKIIPYLKSGGKLPGGCTTKESCDTYCASESHFSECADFAINAGFMTKEEGEILKKTGGKGPGNCRSKEACENYCEDAAHIDECVDFAVKAGFISEADAADAKKYKITSGPGNCKSKADCEAFCVLPENQNTCFEFAKKHGMISEEDLKNIEQYRNQGPPDFSQVSPKWLVCMEKEIGSAAFGRLKAGKSDRSDVSAIQAAQKKCQSEMGPDTKECLAKPTCEEFIACLSPSGSQTSKQGGPEQESPPELKERMDSCQDELQEIKKKEVDEKMDACLSRSCSEFDACIKSVQQSSGGEQQSGQQQQDQDTSNPKLNAKIDACQKEKINACLAKSCGEFQACLNSLGSGGGGGGTSDPAVQAKVKSCQPKDEGGDRSGIPQGYSSWQAFCQANYTDSRCAR